MGGGGESICKAEAAEHKNLYRPYYSSTTSQFIVPEMVGEQHLFDVIGAVLAADW